MLAIGLVLVLVAVLLVLVEAHVSTRGLIAGVALVALLSGVTLLSIGAGAGLITVLAVATGVLGASLAGLVVIGRSLVSVRSLRPLSGTEAMIGHMGVVHAGDPVAQVFIDGGLWRAQCSLPEQESALHDGDRVVVERVTGLTLGVRKAEEWELDL